VVISNLKIGTSYFFTPLAEFAKENIRYLLHNPKSKFHLSLRISYPNAEQINAAKEGNYEPGGDIMIHGYPNKVPAFLFKYWHKWKDWTAGCIAVTNDEIEEIYDAVKDGTPITILP
jgi:murein L,D-transpeptidase YafK